MRKASALLFLLLGLALSTSAQPRLDIDRLTCGILGTDITIRLTLTDSAEAVQTGGFDLMMLYDSNLVFQSAAPGQLLTQCEWEYFIYQSPGAYLVRIIAMAETNNGNHHPICHSTSHATLAELSFAMPTNPGLDGSFLHIQWNWLSCGDNAFSSIEGDTLLISSDIYAYDGFGEWIITRDEPFPTRFGAPSECVTGPGTVRRVDFHNGGVRAIVSDDIPPEVHCPADKVLGTLPGSCANIVTYNIYATDNCGVFPVTCIPPSGSLFLSGTTPVTCIATDPGGNKDTCVFNVTIVDNEPPVVNCPDSIVTQANLGQCGATVSYDVTVEDNCSSASVECLPPSGSYFSVGRNTVLCVAEDTDGNVDTATFDVIVLDVQIPIAIAPPDVTANTDSGECGAVVTYYANVNDNCSGATIRCEPLSGSWFDLGVSTVLCIAEDLSGNADTSSFEVTINDNEAPIAHAPADISAYADSGLCGTTVTYAATATDNCSGSNIGCLPVSGSFFEVGISEVLCIAVDAAGNSDTSLFSVTVTDTVPPVATAPTQLLFDNDSGLCGAVVELLVDVTDNCPGTDAACLPPSGSLFPVGPTPVQCVASDASGNVDTIDFIVTVQDTERPALNCPQDIEVPSDSGLFGAVVTFEATASDNCPGVSLVYEPLPESFFPLGRTEVEVIATDQTGNADTCLFDVTVNLADADGDGLADWEDNCPTVHNPDQEDADSDDVGDSCDECTDTDGDGYGNPGFPANVCVEDNCPLDNNPDQQDSDSDGTGDACCCLGIHGNVDGDADDMVNIADLTRLVNFLFGGGTQLPCPDEANVDGDLEGRITIADLTYLVSYLFSGGAQPPLCP